jgi:hypothetical protein
LAEHLAGLAEGGIRVGDLDSRSLLGAEDDVGRGSPLHLGLVGLRSLRLLLGCSLGSHSCGKLVREERSKVLFKDRNLAAGVGGVAGWGRGDVVLAEPSATQRCFARPVAFSFISPSPEH